MLLCVHEEPPSRSPTAGPKSPASRCGRRPLQRRAAITPRWRSSTPGATACRCLCLARPGRSTPRSAGPGSIGFIPRAIRARSSARPMGRSARLAGRGARVNIARRVDAIRPDDPLHQSRHRNAGGGANEPLPAAIRALHPADATAAPTAADAAGGGDAEGRQTTGDPRRPRRTRRRLGRARRARRSAERAA